MVEAFGDAPRTGLRAPGAEGLRQPGNERPRVALSRVEGVFQGPDIRCGAC
jgi:hypothetical protein